MTLLSRPFNSFLRIQGCIKSCNQSAVTSQKHLPCLNSGPRRHLTFRSQPQCGWSWYMLDFRRIKVGEHAIETLLDSKHKPAIFNDILRFGLIGHDFRSDDSFWNLYGRLRTFVKSNDGCIVRKRNRLWWLFLRNQLEKILLIECSRCLLEENEKKADSCVIICELEVVRAYGVSHKLPPCDTILPDYIKGEL